MAGRFSTKVGILAGSVYVTKEHGIWGTPNQTAELCNTIYKNVPALKTFREEYVGDFLPKDMLNVNYRDYWNSAVLSSFAFLADSPSKMVDLKDYLVETASSLMEEQPLKEEGKAPLEGVSKGAFHWEVKGRSERKGRNFWAKRQWRKFNYIS